MGIKTETKGLFVVIVVLILLLWIHDSTRVNSTYEVIQVTPAKLTFEVMRERCPVVVHMESTRVDAKDVTTKGLTYMYTHYTELKEKVDTDPSNTGSFHANMARFRCIGVVQEVESAAKKNQDSVIEVDLKHPGEADHDDATSSNQITIKLKMTSVLIIPMYWQYRLRAPASDQTVISHHCIVHDTFSVARSLLFGK